MRRFGDKMRRITAILLFFVSLVQVALAANQATEEEEPRVLRVGWYEFAGTYMVNEVGYRSGYGYDYLQELARYGGWSYEYVNGTVTECLQGLQDGEIDLMGCVMYSPERGETMEFSSLSMGKNYSILTTRADDVRYQIGEDRDFDDIHIGALRGDLRQNELQEYAADRGFTYRVTEYDTLELVAQALSEKRVDAILTTSMRVATEKERMIAQFAPVDFFFVTAKGNNRIIQAINATMEQIEFSRKGFQSELSQKYFSVDMSGALAFTEKELEFIQKNPQIHVILPAMRSPMAYLENGEYRGIVVDIMDEIAARIGVQFEYLPVETQDGSVQVLALQGASMIANVYDDYGWAEANEIFLSRPYMKLSYAAVARIENHTSSAAPRIAAVTGYRFSTEYVGHSYPPEHIKWYTNETDCLEAVRRRDADICFVSTHAADDFLSEHNYRDLYSSIISYTHGLSVGVSKENMLLVSLVDKAIASMGETKINAIVDTNTMPREQTLSFGESILRYPLQFFLLFGTCFLLLVALLMVLLITRNNRRKNEEIYRAQLAAERDSMTGLYNRLAFEAVVTQRLQEHRDSHAGIFVMLDIDKFKQVNDKHGHSYGDEVLVALAKGLREQFESYDALLGRMGGDEFAMFFPKWDGKENAVELLRRGQAELAQGAPERMPIPCSFGVAFVAESMCDFSALYQAADDALYSAKREGRGTVCVAAAK